VEKSLRELAALVGGRVTGDETVLIQGVAGLDEAGEREITFLANPKYAHKIAGTRASAVIAPQGADLCGRSGIETANPYLAFAKILTLFHASPSPPKGVMPGAYVGDGVTLGEGVTIYPGACVGDNSAIGDRVTLFPGATIYDGVELGNDVTLHANVVIRERCRIGNRVTVHSGAVIGSDGFGYAPDGKGWYKIPQIGIVVIEDDVEIGANAAIDRAALDVTLIRRGTKIDNLVQIAHNCIIGENCMIVSQVGISGSSKLGDHVTLAGQVGLAGHLEIGANTIVGAKSGVPGNLPGNAMYSGIPAIPHKEWLKSMSTIPRLPDMRKNLNALEKRVRELEERLAAGETQAGPE